MDYHVVHGAIIKYLFSVGEETADLICRKTADKRGGKLALQALSELIFNGDIEGPDLFARYRLTPRAVMEVARARRFPLDVMQRAAERLQEALKPRAERLQVAGSIRRQKVDCGDIELVAIAKDGSLAQALRERALIIVKSGTKYTQAVVVDEEAGPVVVDLFVTADTAQWGMLFFIRTGCADFVERALAHWRRISGMGYCHDNRLCTVSGKPIDTPEEEDVFTALQCRFVAPQDRVERPAATVPEETKGGSMT